MFLLRRLGGIVPLLSVFLASCVAKVEEEEYRNPDVPHQRLPESSQAFFEVRCPVVVPDHVTQCGYVTVPEGPSSQRSIRLFVARVFSNADDVRSEPIVFLRGGPGTPTVESMAGIYPVLAAAAPDRDFIFLDQRGVGYSSPALVCRDSGADVGEVLSNCFDRLSQHADLDDYNTVNNATDIDRLRRAFGYDKVNLWGVSYGTRLALTVLRDHPKGVRAAVLDSVIPLEEDWLGEGGLNAYRSLSKVLEACQDQESCRERYPNSMDRLVDLVRDLNDEPVRIGDVTVTGDAVMNVVFGSLYGADTIAYLPQTIRTLSEGDLGLFDQVRQYVEQLPYSEGMRLSLHCSEELPFSSPEEYQVFDEQVPKVFRAGLSNERMWEYCEHWPVEPAPTKEGEPVRSRVPSLILSGQFDPVTPPRYAEAVHRAFPESQYLLMRGHSHGSSTNPCGIELVGQFLRDPDEGLDEECAAGQDEVPFQ